jgi:hypothetical protein
MPVVKEGFHSKAIRPGAVHDRLPGLVSPGRRHLSSDSLAMRGAQIESHPL